MPLKIQSIKGNYVPLVICDQCGKPITTYKLATYAHIVKLGSDEPTDILYLHNECIDRYEKTHVRDNEMLGTVPLECLTVYIGRVLKVNNKVAEVLADHLAM